MSAAAVSRSVVVVRQVDLVVARALRAALHESWEVEESAASLLRLCDHPPTLRAARARLRRGVLRTPSPAGARAVDTLTRALEQLPGGTHADEAAGRALPHQTARSAHLEESE